VKSKHHKMVSTKLGFVLATLLVAVNAGTIVVPPPTPNDAPVAFEFVGTVEGKIFLLADKLGVIYH